MPETFSYVALLGGSGAETITDTKTLEAAAMALRGKESLALAQEFADATKEELLDLLPKHAGTFVCGDVRVKREAVKGRTTFDKDKIDGTTVAPVNVPMLAGALLAYRAIGSIGDADRIVREHTVPAAYFEKTGKPSERITIEPVSGAKA